MTRIVGRSLLGGLALFAVFVIAMALHNFGPRGLTGDPVLPRGAAMLTPTAEAVATRLANSRGQVERVAPELRQSQQLLTFRGAVLAPPADLSPFSDLPLSSVEGSGSTCANPQCAQHYSIEFGSWADGGIRLSGSAGRGVFDALTPRSCAAESSYCTPSSTAPGRTSATAEYFLDLALLRGTPAVVSHLTCCAGPYWAVSWYDPQASDSYILEMSQRVAERYGTGLSPANRDAAQQLCALASQLIELVSG